jgi:hypothetical protein
MLRLAVFVALSLATNAFALPDDAALSRLIVGTWHEYRHDTRYLPDGTYLADPSENPASTRSGKWRIEGGKLIDTWRFVGAATDSRVVYQIIRLDRHVMRFRALSQDGPFRPPGLVLPSGIYTRTRVD